MSAPAWLQAIRGREVAAKEPMERMLRRADVREPINDLRFPFRREYYLADLGYIAHARADVPALLALVEALAGEIDQALNRLAYVALDGHAADAVADIAGGLSSALTRYAKGPEA